MHRLVFIKYLHRASLEQANEPEPMCAAALLTFHDSIELFLQLASELLNVGSKRVDFMEYFDYLASALGRPLAHREAMRRLNNARISLKHHGTMPAKRAIESFGSAVDDFLTSNTPLVFGKNFGEISLAALVANEDVRACLTRADSEIAQAQTTDALASIAEAFQRLLYAYDVRTQSKHELKRVGEELDRAVNSRYATGPGGKLADIVEKFFDEVALLRHGLDTRRLAVFRALTPHISIAMSGSVHVAWFQDASSATPAAMRFCYDFVVESALRIQQIHSIAEGLPLDRFFGSGFGAL